MKINTKILTSLILGIFLISFASASIGYEFLDDNSVVHIWNEAEISDYYFETNSGIQLTNHYQDYWTRNTFCIGYYNNDEWVKIKCSDELTNFEKSIETDSSTYVDATLWKDFSYQGYDLRLGVEYHLGLNDESLGITIYGKNIGTDIPFDLGFAWKVSDWEIPHEGIGGDSIFINDTNYRLDGNYNLLFKNMEKTIINWTEDSQTNEVVNNGFITTKIPFIKGFDHTQFLKIDWNKNLDYSVKMVGNGVQEDFYMMLMINAGHFSPGQEKSTTFQWIDADSGFYNPTATGEDYNDWNTPTDALTLNDVGAVQFDAPGNQDYYNFGITIPDGATIEGIEVLARGVETNIINQQKLKVELSWDGGDTYTTTDKNFTFTSSLPTWENHTFGSPTDTWGRSWDISDFNNTNFRLRGNNYQTNYEGRIDVFLVKVYYSGGCEEDLQNTSKSVYETQECLETNYYNESRFWVEWDINECQSNVTHYEYRSGVVVCDFCVTILANTSFGSYSNVSCTSESLMLEVRNATQYDTNCDEVANTTVYDFRAVSYCEYSGGYSGSSGGFTPSYYIVANQNDTSDLLQVFRFVDRASDNLFFVVIIAVLWIIQFLSVVAENRSGANGWIWASFSCFVLSVFLSILGLLNSQWVYLIVLMLSFGVFWLTLVKRAS